MKQSRLWKKQRLHVKRWTRREINFLNKLHRLGSNTWAGQTINLSYLDWDQAVLDGDKTGHGASNIIAR